MRIYRFHFLVTDVEDAVCWCQLLKSPQYEEKSHERCDSGKNILTLPLS